MGIILATDITELLNASAPTADTEGVPLDFAKTWRISIHAPAGQTLTSGGWRVYHRNAGGVWTRNQDLDGDLSATGEAAVIALERQAGPSNGRMRLVPISLVLSGAGTTVTVHYELGG